MKLITTALLASVVLAATVQAGQVFPSATYNRTTGKMDIDSGDFDLVAILIGGPDVTGSCFLCETGPNDLPGSMVDLSDFSSWTVGSINNSTQWIRSSPLSGDGFRGKIGEFWIDGTDTQQPWPSDVFILDFPEPGMGIANYGTGLTEDDFTKVFDDGNRETLFSVRFGTDSRGDFYSNVVVIPEPAAVSLLCLLGLTGMAIRRKV